jgi:hypothetical protein
VGHPLVFLRDIKGFKPGPPAKHGRDPKPTAPLTSLYQQIAKAKSVPPLVHFQRKTSPSGPRFQSGVPTAPREKSTALGTQTWKIHLCIR